MDTNNQPNNMLPPPPPGYSASDLVPVNNQGPSSALPPPPPGYSANDLVPVNQTQKPQQPQQTPQQQFEADQWGEGTTLGNIGEQAGNVVEGFGKGIGQTITGADALARKYFPAFMTNSNLGFGKPADINQEQQNLQTQGTAQGVGAGLENVVEFVMGDEALKGIPYIKRLEQSVKTAKVIQNSPKLAQAMQVGMKILKLAGLHGAEAGAVQGAQTLAKTGDIGQAATSGLETGLTAGAIDVPIQGASQLLEKAGDTASNVFRVQNDTKDAKGTGEIAEAMAQKLKDAETQRGVDFENGIGQIKNDLAGQTVDRADSPVAIQAKKSLANPVPEDDALTTLAKGISGDKLDASTKALLQRAADGGVEVTPEQAPAKYQVDQNGNLVTTPAPTPVFKADEPYNADSLIQLRQAVRKAASGYEYSDPNAYALRQLNNSIDDTIGQMAEQSGNKDVLGNYRELRANYAASLHAFDNPVIRNLRDGKVDDAAKAFIGLNSPNSSLPSAGKTTFNIDSLRDAIGDDGVKEFGRDVFLNIMKDSTDNGRLNPAKFVKAWARISDATKGNLFDIDNEQFGLQRLAQHAEAGAKLQQLTRAGVMGGVGAAAGFTGGAALHAMGAGAIIGGLAAETGGFSASVKSLIDYIATNPKTWNLYEKAGRVAEKGTGTTAQVIGKVATDAVNPNPKPKPKQNSWTGAVSSNMSK